MCVLIFVFPRIQIKYLDQDEFKDLKNLKRLRLDRNQLSIVVDNLFHRQKGLELLGERLGNFFPALVTLCIINFPRIINRNLYFSFRIDISWNRLAKISSKAFINLSNLTYLDISYNKLSSLEADCVKHLPRLESLNISGNILLNLLSIQPTLAGMNGLRSLSIADINNIPERFFEPLSNLRVLNISGARLGNETNNILGSKLKLKVSFGKQFFTGFLEEHKKGFKIP